MPADTLRPYKQCSTAVLKAVVGVTGTNVNNVSQI